MIVIIQCAGSKRADAGYLRTADGRKVMIVADPSRGPRGEGVLYARPDDVSDYGATWREFLVAYNRSPGRNALALLPACELYRNDIYRRLTTDPRFGRHKTYILSAGWGLLSADFLTPAYDITFSPSAKKSEQRYKWRSKSDSYRDLCLLLDGLEEDIVAFCSKEYVPLLCRLTAGTKGKRVLFYNSALPPAAPGYTLLRFQEATRSTNWQYDCANAFLEGSARVFD
jgi:hypothetical protein